MVFASGVGGNREKEHNTLYRHSIVTSQFYLSILTSHRHLWFYTTDAFKTTFFYSPLKMLSQNMNQGPTLSFSITKFRQPHVPCTIFFSIPCGPRDRKFNILRLVHYKLLDPYGYGLVHINNIFRTPFPLLGSPRNGCRND